MEHQSRWFSLFIHLMALLVALETLVQGLPGWLRTWTGTVGNLSLLVESGVIVRRPGGG